MATNRSNAMRSIDLHQLIIDLGAVRDRLILANNRRVNHGNT